MEAKLTSHIMDAVDAVVAVRYLSSSKFWKVLPEAMNDEDSTSVSPFEAVRVAGNRDRMFYIRRQLLDGIEDVRVLCPGIGLVEVLEKVLTFVEAGLEVV